MVEIVILLIIYMIAIRAAKYRGRKGPIYGAIAVMAYCLTILLLSFITEDVRQPSIEEFSIILVLVNEYYRKIFICALGASFLVVVVVLLIPRPAAYAGRRPTTGIPYRLIGLILGLGGIGILK